MSASSISPAWLFVSLLLGGVGLALFVYGKKQGRIPQLLAGLAFMVYPYFVDSLWLMVGIAALLLGGLWLAIRWGL